MFDFFKIKRMTDRSVRECLLLFEGIDNHGKPVAAQAFGDAYVWGFWQQVVGYVVSEEQRRPADPKTWYRVMVATLDQIVPGSGSKYRLLIEQVMSAEHPAHANYGAGQSAGKDYVLGLLTNNTEKAQEAALAFRTFIRRVYS